MKEYKFKPVKLEDALATRMTTFFNREEMPTYYGLVEWDGGNYRFSEVYSVDIDNKEIFYADDGRDYISYNVVTKSFEPTLYTKVETERN